MQTLTRQRWFPYALILVTLLVVGGVFFVVARRGSELDAAVKTQLRSSLQEAILTDLAELLDVSEEEMATIYKEEELAEVGAEAEVTESEILTTAKAAAGEVLDESVRVGEINEEQKAEAEQLVVKAVQKHL